MPTALPHARLTPSNPAGAALRSTSMRSATAGSPRTGVSALTLDPASLGLRTLVVPTPVGSMTVRCGRATGAPALLLLHGAAGSWTTWTPLLHAADRAVPLHDVVAVDLPGWGDSPSGRPVDIAATSAALAALLHGLGYERWSVLGHSLGGFLALDLAARTPAETLGVGLVSASGCGVLDAIRRPFRGGARLPGFAGMLAAMRALAALGAAGDGVIRGLHRIGVLAPLSAPLFAQPSSIDPSVIAALAREIRPAAFASAARAAARYDETRWRDVRAPVVAVRGERDVFVGERDARRFGGLIVDFREVRIPDAGHFAAVERPREVLDAFADILPR